MAGTDLQPQAVEIGPVAAVKPARVTRRLKVRHWVSTGALYVLAVAILSLMVLPYFYLTLQSLAPWNQIDRTLIPSALTLRSYIWLLEGGQTSVAQPWLQALLNSLGVTLIVTFCQVAIGALVAYGLSILRFRGAVVVKTFIMFHMFYPSIILLVPTFILIRMLGLYNNFWAMVLPTTVSLFAIFMLSSFFLTIPTELIEAARLDGANELRILYSIILPASRSILTVVALFLFVERWSNLLWDLMVIKDPARQTLNVLMATMFGPYGGYPGPLYASGVILTIPLVILFLLFSKNFIQGVQFVLK